MYSNGLMPPDLDHIMEKSFVLREQAQIMAALAVTEVLSSPHNLTELY